MSEVLSPSRLLPPTTKITKMNIGLTYLGGRTYGTGKGSTRYVAKFTCDEDKIRVYIRFVELVRGITDNSNTWSNVEGLSLSLNRNEALKLGTMLLEAAQRPAEWFEELTWVPPDVMPCLDVSDWKDTVKLECLGYEADYKIENDSKFHLGVVTLECSCTDYGDEELQRIAVNFPIDLPRGESRNFTIREHFYGRGMTINGASLVAATGADLSKVWMTYGNQNL